MKVFGHPLHPLFIHFPTALLPMDLVLSALSYSSGDPSFALAGFYCLAGGVLSGLAAITTGLLALTDIPKTNKQALANGLVHGFLNGFLILVFGVMAYKEWQLYPQPPVATITLLLVKGILVIALFVGNYLGGKLIYQHFIGINIKPTEHGKTAS
jgi:uncharacterized membrane protein